MHSESRQHIYRSGVGSVAKASASAAAASHPAAAAVGACDAVCIMALLVFGFVITEYIPYLALPAIAMAHTRCAVLYFIYFSN